MQGSFVWSPEEGVTFEAVAPTPDARWQVAPLRDAPRCGSVLLRC